jgi:hypothetical protein
MSSIESKLKTASDLANKFECKLRVDAPSNRSDDDYGDSWVIDLTNDDGPADEVDNILAHDPDLETALDRFIEKAQDEDPDSFGGDDDEED